MTLPRDFYNRPPQIVARDLLGKQLIRIIDCRRVGGIISEVEAYGGEQDLASHAKSGLTPRNKAMYGPAGYAYIYFTYGMHHCCNVVCGPEGFGSGVLIRAVEPVEGVEMIEARRGMSGVNVTNGPGKICHALDIDRRLSGHSLAEPPVWLIRRPALPDSAITTGPRIGISKAVHELRRFYVTDSRYVSKR